MGEDISRLLEGAPEAWGDFVQCHGESLLRMAVLLVGDRDTAQDALQEGLLAAYRARQRFRGEARFHTWVTAIVINECRKVNRLSAQRERAERISASMPEPARREDTSASAEFGSLYNAIASLGEQEREIVTLYYFNDWKVSAIATFLGLKEGTVKSHLARARNRLRSILRRIGEGDDE